MICHPSRVNRKSILLQTLMMLIYKSISLLMKYYDLNKPITRNQGEELIAHKYSMTTSTLTSVVLRYLFFGVMMFTIITTISVTNAPSTYGNYEYQVKGDDGHLKDDSEIVTDYVDWSPNPIFGGGRAGLIPH